VESGTCSSKPTEKECEINVAAKIGQAYKGTFENKKRPYGCLLYTDRYKGVWFNTARGSTASCSSGIKCLCTAHYTKVNIGYCNSVSTTDCEEIATDMGIGFRTIDVSKDRYGHYPAGCYNKKGTELIFNKNLDKNPGSCTSSRTCYCDARKGCVKTRGGNAGGACCHFPFTNNGIKYYNTCSTSGNNGVPWCYTTPDDASASKWGNCIFG